MFRILIDDVFLECSQYYKYESNMSNKRINGPPILLSKQTKKKRGIVTALPLRRRKESVFCEKLEVTVALLLEQISKIL